MTNINNKYYKRIMERTEMTNRFLEMSYDGNIGFHEVMLFFQKASPEQTEIFERLMKENKIKEAWELVQNVVGIQLKGF